MLSFDSKSLYNVFIYPEKRIIFAGEILWRDILLNYPRYFVHKSIPLGG